MGLRMEDTGTSSNPACILTYYERLHELDAKYSRANNGVGVGTDILRTKLMELPQAYSFAVHCMEQDDIAARRDSKSQGPRLRRGSTAGLPQACGSRRNSCVAEPPSPRGVRRRKCRSNWRRRLAAPSQC